MRLLASLVFVQPALAFGVAGAAVPILIHLLLRPRPRRVRFPALVLLRPAFALGQRANRLRNLLLLLVRALVVGLAALLLAGPTCTQAAPDFVGSGPFACVVVVDDSASLSYRVDGGPTLLDLARARALEFVESSVPWPAGSALAALRAGSDEPQPPWTTDRSAVLGALRARGGEAAHARTLAGALRAAAELLRSAPQPARRIVFFTDGAAHAWRDVTPAIMAGIDRLALRVVVPHEDHRTNLALLVAAGPSRLHSATAPVPVWVTVAAEGLQSECWLIAQQDGRTLQRWGPLRLAADTTREVTLELPALPPGPHALTLQLAPPDRMLFDQQRYLACQTAPRPMVWLVVPAGAKVEADVSALILRNLLAPEILTAEQQLVELHVLGADQVAPTLAATEPQHQPVLTVIMSDAVLPATTVPLLQRHVERGATVLLVPASFGGDVDSSGLGTLWSTAPATEEQIDLTTLHWEPASPYAAVEDLAELTRCAVRSRLQFGTLREGVVVYARYADEAPAIVSQSIGTGRIVALTTSPDPQWSDLGVRAAGLMSWLHRLVDEATGPLNAVAAFALGEVTRYYFAALPASGQVRVAPQTEPNSQDTWIRLADGVPEQPWPTGRAGCYALSAAGADRQNALYVVNWPPEESRLEPIALPQLRQLLGRPSVWLDTPTADQTKAAPSFIERILAVRNLTQPLAALLLIAFVLESLLAARRQAGLRHNG